MEQRALRYRHEAAGGCSRSLYSDTYDILTIYQFDSYFIESKQATASTTDAVDITQGMLRPTLYSVLTLIQITLQHHSHTVVHFS